MPISAVCSTNKRGAMVSLKSSEGILRRFVERISDDVVTVGLGLFGCSSPVTHLAASSRIRHCPPVPFVPSDQGSFTNGDDLSHDDRPVVALPTLSLKTENPPPGKIPLASAFYKIRCFDAVMCHNLPPLTVTIEV
jgi:hypothetical protein